MASFEGIVKSSGGWLQEIWNQWRGALVLGAIVIVLGWIALSYSGVIITALTTNKEIAKNVAVVIVFLFSAFCFGLVVTFFWLFRGIKADENQLNAIITYCYAFIVFSLLASVLPFFALPLIPQLYASMTKSPVGIVAGCSLAASPVPRTIAATDDKPVSKADDKPSAGLESKSVPKAAETTSPVLDDKSVPKELRCDTNADQWVVNIGGTMSPDQSSEENRLVRIRGGLVVPLYAIVLSLMGAAVSMTRRVPEFQRRLSPGDPEYITFDQAREGLVFQIMQVASAPLIAVTAYYVVDPGSRASTIALSFASGFSSETVLLLIRAILEKMRPTAPAATPKNVSVGVAPARLDFGIVASQGSARKSIAIANPGPATLAVSSLTCSGEFSPLTQVPFNVAPQSSGTIELEFRPTTVGAKQGQLTITDNALGSPRSVDLSGTGT